MQFDGAVMRFGDPFDDGKSEAEAAIGAGAGFIGAEEALENVRGGVRRNADPRIGDAQADEGAGASGEVVRTASAFTVPPGGV